MDFSLLFTSRYYLDVHPGGEFLIGFVLLPFFIALMFSARIARNLAKGNKYLRKSMKKKFWMFPFWGALGVIAVLSRFGGIPVFSMRLILYILFVGSFLLLGISLYRVRREYKQRIASVARMQQ